MRMEKKPKLSEMLYGSVRAGKMYEASRKIIQSGKPAILLDVEASLPDKVKGALHVLGITPKRDDIIEGQD